MKLRHWAVVAVWFVAVCLLFDWVADRARHRPSSKNRSAELAPDSTYTVAWVKQDPDGLRTMETHVVHGGRDSVYRNGVLWSVGAVTRSTPTRDGGLQLDKKIRWYESPDPLTPAQVDRLARIWEAKR